MAQQCSTDRLLKLEDIASGRATKRWQYPIEYAVEGEGEGDPEEDTISEAGEMGREA